MLPVNNVGIVCGSRGDNAAAVFSIADSKRYGTYQSLSWTLMLVTEPGTVKNVQVL